MKILTLPTIAAALFSSFAMLATASAEEKSPLSAADQTFVKTASQSGMSEVKVAELGVKKAENSEVKSFAEMLVKHHTEANTELGKLAEAKGVQLSSSAPAEAADKVQGLEKQSGKNFDKEFLQGLISSHKTSIKNFENVSADSKDSELKSWVDKTLPTLKAHLEQAQALEAKY